MTPCHHTLGKEQTIIYQSKSVMQCYAKMTQLAASLSGDPQLLYHNNVNP